MIECVAQDRGARRGKEGEGRRRPTGVALRNEGGEEAGVREHEEEQGSPSLTARHTASQKGGEEGEGGPRTTRAGPAEQQQPMAKDKTKAGLSATCHAFRCFPRGASLCVRLCVCVRQCV